MIEKKGLALITGASAGIGQTFAEFLAREGFDLVIVARRRERLEELATRLKNECGITVHIIVQDLSERAAANNILSTLEDLNQKVDVLVNNAGYAIATGFRRTQWTDIADFLEVLMIGQVELMHGVLPGMRERNYGRILNIASLAAFAPENPGGLYGAVKRFMVSASRAVWMECRGTGVHVTAVCPGYTWSEFHDVLGNRKQMNSLPRFMWQTSQAVVEEGWRACEKNRAVVVTGFINKCIRALCHLLPISIIGRIAPKATRRKISKQRGGKKLSS